VHDWLESLYCIIGLVYLKKMPLSAFHAPIV
jgi:hypothetical protein